MSSLQRVITRFGTYGTAALYAVSRATSVLAQDNFGGEIPPIAGTPNSANIRETIVSVLTFVLNFLALLAIIFIVIAGLRLIVSQGDEEQKDKAKKTILYVIIGLLVILFARVIVSFFTGGVTQELDLPTD